MFIETIKRKFKPGQPILIGDLLLMFPNFSRAYVFRLVNKAIERNEILKVSRGVYCLPKQTSLGYYTPTSRTIMERKYVSYKADVYGVLSGLALLNSFAVIPQVPNDIEFVSNKEKTRRREIQLNGMNFILRKSRFEITKENKDYYEILQLFLEISKGFKIDYLSRKLIVDFIKEKNLKEDKLLMYATSFPQVVMKQLLESGVIYEVFHKQEESE